MSAALLLAAAVLLGLLMPLNVRAQATVPGTPTIDGVTARAGWMLVEWSAPSSDGGSAITAYDVRYIETDASNKADDQWTETENVWTTGDGVLRYSLDGLTNDTGYDVQVRAVNAEGDGPWSATVTGTPELSEATRATLSAVRGDDGALAVTWKSPTTLVDADTTYDLRYIETDATDKSDGEWTETTGVSTDDLLLYGITGLTNNTEYDAQVRAVEFATAGPWSDTMSATPADYRSNLNYAREITLATTSSGELDPMGSNYFWGRIDEQEIYNGFSSSSDWDTVKMVITDEQVPNPMDFQIYTEGSLDTVGILYDGNGDVIIQIGNGPGLPNPENFLIRRTLEAGTYYIRVHADAGVTGAYVLRIKAAPETTGPSDPKKLTVGGSVSGSINPPNETDSYELELTERTDVIIRGWGLPDVTAQLANEHGAVLAQNNDGNLHPKPEGFLIRRLLDAGTYELKVSSHRGVTSGGYTVYTSDAGNPGSTAATAQAIALERAAGGNITSTSDADYFSITVDDTTYVQIWAAPNTSGTDVDAEIVDAGGTAIDADFNENFAGPYARIFSFGIAHELDAGTHYVKVTGAGNSTGRYTVIAIDDWGFARMVDTCQDVSRGGISDTWYGCQWHLQDDGLSGSGSTEDINVEGVWSGGNRGAGITVAVVDQGMHHQHEDLTDNVDTSKNHDFVGQGGIYHPFETHGTAVAGIIAARDNSIGTRGVAPRATIYGYNLLSTGDLNDEFDAMSLNAATTAVSNNSWGQGDTGSPEYARSMWAEVIENAVTTGYGGKGVFYVWSAGNGARNGDYSTLDERNNFYAVTAACAVNQEGKRTYYSEKGANLWVCAPSDDSGTAGIATTTNSNRYTNAFGGTSAAAPIVSGVAALIRKANNALTWRDVKLILAASARKNDASNSGWETGASKYGDTGTYNFNHEYGFGVVDAQAAVNLANGWTNVPGLRRSTVESGTINLTIPDATSTDAGATVTSKLTVGSHVEFIEYVHVDAHFDHDSFRHLDVELESPDGKISKLAPYFDQASFGSDIPFAFVDNPLRLGSAKHLGESAAGEWTLRVTDHIQGKQGTLDSWDITVFGHGTKPAAPDIDEAQPTSGGFSVTWKTPADPGASAITGYDVHYIRSDASDKSDGEWTSATTGASARQYSASGLDGEVEYDVRVRAVNAKGDGEWSTTAKVPTGSADAPTITSVTSVGQTLVTDWTAPANSSLGTVTSYDLRHKFTNFGGWTTVDSIWTSATGGPLEYTLVPTAFLGYGRSHYVQLRAVVGTTEHPWSASRMVITVPNAPTITDITADPSGGQINVQWSRAVSASYFPVTSHDLRYIETGEDEAVDANWTVKTDVPSGREGYTIEGLTNWVQYDVQVRGLNAGGPGPWSDTVTGTPANTAVRVTLQWAETTADVNEDGGSVTLTAVATTDRDQALPSDFSFDATVTTEDGTATESADYVLPSNTALTFEESDFERVSTSSGYRYRATREFSVTIVSDDVDENDEAFTATLDYAGTQATNLLGGNSVATITIKDDEQVLVTLGWLDDAVSVNESSSVVRLNATATTTSDKRPESGFSFDATVATSPGTANAGDDYTHVSTTVTFQQSDFGSVTVDGNRRYRATKSISVPIVNDTDDERDETFTATVDYVDSNPSHLQGGPASATVTIQDNDLPTVSISAVDTSAEEDDTLEFRLARVGVPDDALTVNVRVSETRRMLAPGQPTTATFSAGSSTATLDIALSDDSEDEDNSTVTVALGSGSGYVLGTDSSDTATALDNDHVPVTLSWAVDPVTVAEGAGQVALKGVATTTKDKQPESGFAFVAEVTFADGTADSSDYTGQTQSRTFRQSDFTDIGQRYQATGEFTVNIAGGDGSEDDETFTATLAYVGSAPLPSHLQGGSATVTVTITVIDDNVAPEFEDGQGTTRSIAENSAPGTAVGDPVEATDLNDDPLAYEISSQQGGPYTVDNTTGQIRVGDGATLDHERRTTQRVNLKVEDPDGLSDTIQVQIEIADVNEPPVINGNAALDWRENRTGNVTRYTAADPERDAIEWSVTGTDAGFFTIDAQGYLAFNDPPDFEAGGGNTYNLRVVATDDGNPGETGTLDVMVTVTDVNEPPTVTGDTVPTVDENTATFSRTYSATDPEGASSTFTWSLSGTDGGDFSIDRNSGELTFRNTPDYERPADSNGDNEYLLTVVTADQGNLRGNLPITVTVNDVNEPPTITGTESLSYAENSVRPVATYRATDPERGTITWSLSGDDRGDFNIGETGVLTFASIPDFEIPVDADQDNEYLVTVQARDDGFNFARLDVTVTVTNSTGAEEPTITTTSNPSPYQENGTRAVYTFRARDPQGRAVTWSLEGDDADDFNITTDGGVLTFASPPDFENPTDADRDNVYEITVVAADNRGLRDSVPATITITDQSEGPVIAGTTSFTVEENYDIAQALGTYTATDAKDGRRVYPQWSLSGRDGGDFVIDRYSGELSFRYTPDYDRPADSDRDNIYELTIRGHDSRAYGYLHVLVTVTNINEGAPVVTGSTARTVRENTTSTIYTYRATDPDLGDTITWSTAGTDGANFVVTEDRYGRGTLAFASPPDFEAPTDADRDNVYELEVVATDVAGLKGTLAVIVTVTALNEGPVVSGTAAFTIDENQDLTGAVYTARDPEAIGGVTTTITWSVSGRDGGDFLIDRETGQLTFRTPPDHERPADYNRDNVYDVTVRAYDGRNYGTFDVTVTVLAVNERPEITGRDTFTYRENSASAIYTYRATDPEGDDFTWGLGGPDASDFAITTDSSGRGVLAFASPPDFDLPSGSGTHRNEYLVTVQARDANFNVGELPVTVTVTDLNEGATVSGRTEIAVQENYDPTLVLATYSATDPENQTITRWSLSGLDGGDFTINEDGELTFRYTPDYDRPADSNGDNEYRITVRAYDGRTYGNLDVTVTVSNVNEHDPVIQTGSRASFSYREESTSVLYTYRVTDGDKDDVITWSTSGTDGSRFAFNDRDGLVFSAPPDYESPGDFGRDNEYNLEVVATDSGGRSASLAVTVTVTAVDEGPEISGRTSYTVREGEDLIGAAFTATDPEDPSIAVTNWRTSGTDGGDFTISQEGVLSFRNTPDYDRPADANRDNEYLVTVQVSDGRYYGSLAVTVTVTDQNESSPVVTGNGTLSFRENTATATRLYTYRVTDADRGATITWSVRGTDGDDFSISDGVLTFRSPPDHERPADANFDNVYEITVVASDGINEGTLDVTITVTEVNEGPEISGAQALTFAENTATDRVLATYTGIDPEDTGAETTRWSTSGRDGGDFTINSEGELTFRYPPNHERPADSGGDNVYELTVRASDGRVYGYYDVVVTVEPVDEAPDFRSGSRETFTYQENRAWALYTYRATDPEGADVTWSVGGSDAGYFGISASGVLAFSEPPNFENPARFDGSDYDNEYEVTVEARDQSGNTARLEVTVTVTDVNEGPEVIGCTETEFETVLVIDFEDCDAITVVENHDEPLYTYTARDPEIPTLEITRWTVSGRDGGDFTIDENGELSFRNPPDHERPVDSNGDNVYEVTVRASDGRYYGSYDVVVTVEAVDEAPDFRSNSQDTFSYRENQTADLYTYRATDPEGADVTWSLSGIDAHAFEISEDGVLTFRNVPDYEEPADADDDNLYLLTVEASDETGNTSRLEVTVIVVNLTD